MFRLDWNLFTKTWLGLFLFASRMWHFLGDQAAQHSAELAAKIVGEQSNFPLNGKSCAYCHLQTGNGHCHFIKHPLGSWRVSFHTFLARPKSAVTWTVRFTVCAWITEKVCLLEQFNLKPMPGEAHGCRGIGEWVSVAGTVAPASGCANGPSSHCLVNNTSYPSKSAIAKDTSQIRGWIRFPEWLRPVRDVLHAYAVSHFEETAECTRRDIR